MISSIFILWKNIIRGRFFEESPPAYECTYLHANTHVLCKYGHTAHITGDQ